MGRAGLGQRDNANTETESAAILQRGFDAGINFIDTAEGYKTEGIVGLAMQGRDRDSIVISTKKSMGRNRIDPADVEPALEESLRKLGTDHIDVYHLHGVAPDVYDYALNEIVPVLQRMRQAGKIRYLGITESWNSDLQHEMLIKALQDDVWDVMMVGFNVLNQTARKTIFAPAIEKNIGILVMFAIRLALSREDRLVETIQSLVEAGQVDPADIDLEQPLSFLLDEAPTIADAAYRFCREEPGTHVVLSGTGNPVHLHANIETFDRPPLSATAIERLRHIFRNVDSVSGQ